jgi:hypothetical protein
MYSKLRPPTWSSAPLTLPLASYQNLVKPGFQATYWLLLASSFVDLRLASSHHS